MRLSRLCVITALASVALLCACAAKPSGPSIPGFPANAVFLDGPPKIYKVVSLNRDGALEALRTTHPGHYAIAQRLIKAAGQICAPGAPKTQATLYHVDNVSCAAEVWYESNPPKRMLMFWVDDTVYEMLVPVEL